MHVSNLLVPVKEVTDVIEIIGIMQSLNIRYQLHNCEPLCVCAPCTNAEFYQNIIFEAARSILCWKYGKFKWHKMRFWASTVLERPMLLQTSNSYWSGSCCMIAMNVKCFLTLSPFTYISMSLDFVHLFLLTLVRKWRKL